MWALQLLLVSGSIQADEAGGDSVSLAERMLQAMQTRLDASLHRAGAAEAGAAGERQQVALLTKQNAALQADFATEQARNVQWHEVANTLQDQVDAAEDKAARAAALARRHVQAPVAATPSPAAAREAEAAASAAAAKADALEREKGALQAKVASLLQAARAASAAASASEGGRSAVLAHALQARLEELDEAQDQVASLQGTVATLQEELAAAQRARRESVAHESGLRAEQSQASLALVQAHRALGQKAAQAANSTAQQRTAEARMREAVEAAEEARRDMLARLKQIATLQEQVSTLQDSAANLTATLRGAAQREDGLRAAARAREAALGQNLRLVQQEASSSASAAAASQQEQAGAEKAARQARAEADRAADLAGVSQRRERTAEADARDARSEAEAAQKAATTAQEEVTRLRGKAGRVGQQVAFLDHAQAELRDAYEKANASLTETQVALTRQQQRGAALEQLSARAQQQRGEAQQSEERQEGEAETLRTKITALQRENDGLTDRMEKVNGRLRQAETSENEYFDSMTTLQSAKDDQDRGLKQAQDEAATAKKDALDLQRSNEYLRGEKKTGDAATEAAMSDYLKEIEGMKVEQERLQQQNRGAAAQVQEMTVAVSELWSQLTPAQRRAIRHRKGKR